MFKSPPACGCVSSSQVHLQSLEAYEEQHRKSSFHNKQGEITPTRQDSGCFSVKGTLEEERMLQEVYLTPSRPSLGSELLRAPCQSSSTLLLNGGDTNKPQSHETERQRKHSGVGAMPEIGLEIQARQMRARERLTILRGRVLRTRRNLKEQMVELRQLRESVRDAISIMTRKANELTVFGKLEDIEAHYERLQAAQAQLGPAEELYDRWDQRLDEEEEELEQEEDYFYRHFDVSIFVPESMLDEELSPRFEPYEPPDDDLDDPAIQNERVREYLSKVAEAERFKEDLETLEHDYTRSLSDTNLRKRHGIPTSAESSAFLADYPRIRAEIIKGLHDVEHSIFELRSQCLGDNLFHETDFIYEYYNALYEDIMNTVYDFEDRSPLRTAANYRESCISKPDFTDKKAYVNSWLLQVILDSPLNILLLKVCICAGHNGLPSKWPELALQNWNFDEAGEFTNEYYNASKIDAIPGSMGILSDSFQCLGVDVGEQRAQNVILGSETGSYVT